jgi:hypothetical protein
MLATADIPLPKPPPFGFHRRGHAHPPSRRYRAAPATASRKRAASPPPSRRDTAMERGTSHPAASRTWWCSHFYVPTKKDLDLLITGIECRSKRARIAETFFTVGGGEASDTRLTRRSQRGRPLDGRSRASHSSARSTDTTSTTAAAAAAAAAAADAAPALG